MVVYWNVLWKTFAQLAAAALVGLQSLDWTVSGFQASSSKVGLALILAGIGALVAALWAYVSSPATTALQKALRSLVQALAGGIGAIVVNTWTDIVTLPRLLVPIAVAAVLAFVITYFQNQVAPAPAG